MKKIILVTLILSSTGVVTNAQNINSIIMDKPLAATSMFISNANTNNNPDSAFNKEYYLKKSRNNRIASLCLVGGGLVIAGIGALTFPKDYDLIFENEADKESKADASTALIVVGIAAMLSSIPFTVMASVNKRKANLMVSSQKTGFGVPPNVGKHITGVTMTITLGK